MLSAGDHVTVGVSGGADSVALLYVLEHFRRELDLRLLVVHINHGLRPEAGEEAEYVRKICRELDIPFFLQETDVSKVAKEKNLGIEEAGRAVRYEAFSAHTPHGGKIAVAHNMNDLAETMLFNLSRGTGPRGLAGIAPVRGNIIRPLLCAERQEIEDYLKELGVPYCTDKSNLTGEYTRNRIRNNIIPMIRKDVQDRVIPHMFETAEQLRSLNDLAESLTGKEFDRIADAKGDSVSFSRTEFVKEHPYIREMLIKAAIDRLVPGNRDITAIHINSVVKLSLAEGSGEADLPYGIKATAGYEKIRLTRGEGVRSEAVKDTEICIQGETIVPGFGRIVCTLLNLSEIPEISRKEYTKCMDYDRITAPLLIRVRQPGDMITVARDSHRKLKDFFIDSKIDRELRDSIPVVAMGREVIWIPGIRLFEAVKITPETRRVLVMDIIKEDIC